MLLILFTMPSNILNQGSYGCVQVSVAPVPIACPIEPSNCVISRILNFVTPVTGAWVGDRKRRGTL